MSAWRTGCSLAHTGFDYPRCVTNRFVGSANGARHTGREPGKPARVFTGATGRPERDRGSERKPKEHTMRADIIPGGTFPDYELTDHAKARRRLSELTIFGP